jgi:hypothetical protein
MGWAAAIGPIIQMVTGIIKDAETKKQLRELGGEQAFTPTSSMLESTAMLQRRAREGATPAEEATFRQNLARQTASAERAMRNAGVSGAGIANIFNIDALNRFSELSEQTRRQGEQMYANQAMRMQGISDANTRAYNQQLRAQQIALGQAGAAAGQDISGGVMGIASAFSGMSNDPKEGATSTAGFGSAAAPDYETEFKTYSDDLLKSGIQGYDFMGDGFSQGTPNYYGTTNNLYGTNIGYLNQSGLNTGGGYFPGDQFQNQNAGSAAPIGSYESFLGFSEE